MFRVLAFDFGASSGRAVIGCYNGNKIELHEVHRFSNDPVKVGKTLYWDVLRLFHEIKQGIIKAKLDGGFDSIGIDTWGVDFGLIDSCGVLCENPVHYRDERNNGMIEEAEKLISKAEMYNITGIQFMDFNSAFQLLSLKQNRPSLLERTDKILFMPDLFNYLLTGKMFAEYSIATTSQLIDIKSKTWSKKMTSALEIPYNILPEIIKPGAVIGNLSSDICAELGVPPVPVIAVCGHDTQSAICAVPSEKKDFAFISSGTWSLFGTETDAPIVNEKAREFNVTNEGGYNYSTAFLKNICGLWLIQESRRQWIREGAEYSFADLEKLALESKPFKCFIDPDADVFSKPGNLPKKIAEFCKKTCQAIPETVGETVRCIYESLSFKYRCVLEGIQDCAEKRYDKLHVVGGGTKDKLLLQMTADFCNLPVIAGPVEATVLGNVAVQLISSGEIANIAAARKIIKNGEALKEYLPSGDININAAYKRFTDIIA